MDNFRDSYFQVQWDLTKKRLNGQFWGKQYDTGRGFSITVISGGQVVTPTTEIVRLKWEKPDSTTGYVDATIINGKFVIENIDQMFTVHGSVRADFEVWAGGKMLSSITFYVTVEKAVAVGAIQSSSEFTALQSAVADADMMIAKYSLVKQTADEAMARANSMASGSPKGVYATLSLLQAAYPTGTTGAHLVTADGKWYYWSGNAWVVGGVYQAIGIADSSIKLKNLSDLIFNKIPNIKDYGVATNALSDFIGVGTTALSLNNGYIKASSLGEPVKFKQYKDWGLPIANKILVTFKVRSNKAGNIIIYLLTNNVGGLLASTTQSISATERTISIVMSGPTICNGIQFSCNDFATSGDFVEIFDLIVADLTPIFGAGNEPTANILRHYLWCSGNKYTDAREFLMSDNIQGATVYVVKGENTYTLTHNVLLSDINLVLRTDVITIAGIVVTEVKTAFSGDMITITTNTTTLSTKVV